MLSSEFPFVATRFRTQNAEKENGPGNAKAIVKVILEREPMFLLKQGEHCPPVQKIFPTQLPYDRIYPINAPLKPPVSKTALECLSHNSFFPRRQDD